MYNMKDDGVMKNHIFFLRGKHLYSISAMNQILARAKVNKANTNSDLKCVSNMVLCQLFRNGHVHYQKCYVV